MTLGRLAEVWRYPVNGLQGEGLTEGRVLTTGVSGDHLYAIRDTKTNRVLDPKSYSFSWGDSQGKPAMLELSSRLSGDPEGGHEVSISASGRTICTTKDPDVNQRLSAALGDSVELVRYPRFAESRVRSGRTLHLLTTASLARMSRLYPGGDFNPRRFRPNIVVETPDGTDGFVEEGWVGRDIEIGGVRLRIEKPNVRCKVTTMMQPGIREDPRILETIQRENGSNLGVLGRAVVEGGLRVGDSVTLG